MVSAMWGGTLATSAGSTRSTRPTPVCVDEARPGAAEGLGGRGRPPDRRPGAPGPPLGGAAGGQPAGLGAPAARLRRRRPAPVHRRRWPWPPRTPVGEVAGVGAGAQVAQRPARRRAQAGRRPGRGGIRRAAPWSAVVVGIGHQRRLARSRRRRAATCLDDLRGRRSRWTARPCSTRLLGASRTAGRAARRRRRAAGPGRRAPPVAAPRWASRCGSSWPASRSTGWPSPSTTPATWWSRPPAGPRAVAAGDVVHLRPGPRGWAGPPG